MVGQQITTTSVMLLDINVDLFIALLVAWDGMINVLSINLSKLF